ncbi:hypothetical protein [Paracraurococcus lichenis]|uniref:Uncharacterized protein n=1 Tax=Paracraurococcus lichenis TaxID=3064888 RepID=A0ABT9E9Y5_9PROT|nr:hypothetical protein [Paracraurococcus sp. LOR1-02]MDO9713021.1 hypothetical protein [Paracraurococcus sp. LOR1-02]
MQEQLRCDSGRSLHLAFQAPVPVQAALIRKIFSSNHVRSITSTRPLDLVRVLARRVFA